MKTILITGSTDGIGLLTAQNLLKEGHHVLIHGRNPQKVKLLEEELKNLNSGRVSSYVADLSDLEAVKNLAFKIKDDIEQLDVLINNAGIYVTSDKNIHGLDIRFLVNTIAPYLLTKLLLPLFQVNSRVVNLSSAAQAPVSIHALENYTELSDGEAYAQSKLALTMWSFYLGTQYKQSGPMIVSVNPKSLLGSKMVKTAYGISGGDLNIGADILCKAALDSSFLDAHGQYFDNDIARFAPPHEDAMDQNKSERVVQTLEKMIKEYV